MKISFWNFIKKHCWLFAICAILPIIAIVIVFQYCIYYKCSIEQSSIATIVIGALTYIGTILWGIFIYYKSWVDKEIQEYKNRPIIESKVLLSSKGSQSFRLYEKSEVEDSLNVSIMYHGLEQFNNTNIKYALIEITNYGTTILSNLKIEFVVVKKWKNVKIQEYNNYVNSVDFAKTLLNKDKWELFVAIDESLIETNDKGVPEIIIALKFNNNFIDTYYNIITLQFVGKGSYSAPSVIYTEEDYEKLKIKLFNL